MNIHILTVQAILVREIRKGRYEIREAITNIG